MQLEAIPNNERLACNGLSISPSLTVGLAHRGAELRSLRSGSRDVVHKPAREQRGDAATRVRQAFQPVAAGDKGLPFNPGSEQQERQAGKPVVRVSPRCGSTFLLRFSQGLRRASAPGYGYGRTFGA